MSPRPAARRGYAFLIQCLRNRAGAFAGRVALEYALNDRRLVRVRLAQAAYKLAALVQAIGPAVPIGEPGRGAALRDRAALPPLDTGAQIGAKAGVHQSFDGAADLIYHAVHQREETAPGKLQPLSYGEGIALMPRDTVRRFGQHLLDPAGLDAQQHRVQPGPLRALDAGGAADGVIGEDFLDRPAFALGAFAADGDLILDRAGVLQLARISGVDDRPHRAFLSIEGLLCLALRPHAQGPRRSGSIPVPLFGATEAAAGCARASSTRSRHAAIRRASPSPSAPGSKPRSA